MLYSIKPKLDDHLFVGLGVFTNSYMFLTCCEPKIVLIFRTILGSHQAKTGKNSEINKQSAVIFWINNRMYSFSCID